MRIREQDVLIPTSMVGNYPNPRWWDAAWARHFRGDREPPDSMSREALEDAIGAIALDQEKAGLDIISDGRVQGDNYADRQSTTIFVHGLRSSGRPSRLSNLQPAAFGHDRA